MPKPHACIRLQGGAKKTKKRNVFIDDIADVDDDEEEEEEDVGAGHPA